MPRMYGYAVRGERCYGSHNWQRRRRTNVLGALLDKNLIRVGLIEGHINTSIFNSWIRHELLPYLPPKSVLVLDNAAFHKSQEFQTEVQKAGHDIEYLPAYSPDLNPIEHKWAQAKAARRKYQCDIDTLFQKHVS